MVSLITFFKKQTKTKQNIPPSWRTEPMIRCVAAGRFLSGGQRSRVQAQPGWGTRSAGTERWRYRKSHTAEPGSVLLCGRYSYLQIFTDSACEGLIPTETLYGQFIIIVYNFKYSNTFKKNNPKNPNRAT